MNAYELLQAAIADYEHQPLRIREETVAREQIHTFALVSIAESLRELVEKSRQTYVTNYSAGYSADRPEGDQ